MVSSRRYKKLLALTNQLIACDEDVERSVFVVVDILLTPELPERCSIFDIAPIGYCLDSRDEAGKFLLPVVKC